MSELQLHHYLAWSVIGVGAVVFVLLLVITAPYGRHARAGWGPTMPTRWAWTVMESPAVWAFVLVYLQGAQRLTLVPLLLLGMWQLHYINRSFIYPWRIRATGKRTAISVAAMAILFNVVNAYLNARQLSHFGAYPNSWILQPNFIVGTLLFFVGRHINVRADDILISLRQQEDGYRIPQGWLYHYISCPNYFGEVSFWWGLWLFAIAAAPTARWTILGPIAMTLMFWFVSIPLIDKRMLRKRPHYAAHMKLVSRLFPWLPGAVAPGQGGSSPE